MEEETAKTIIDGWLYTGDYCRIDKDGYIYIVDRKNDLIISGGKNIYPKEVEEVFYMHPAVMEATVVGVPDDHWGEAVKAVVVTRPGAHATEEERVKPGFMPAAPVPAAQMALDSAGISISDIKAIKNHNPFAINDINLAKQMGIDVMSFNNYGSSMIFGHPQSPTAGRLIAELIEELVLLGGGYGLASGCAAGDTAAAMVIKVG